MFRKLIQVLNSCTLSGSPLLWVQLAAISSASAEVAPILLPTQTAEYFYQQFRPNNTRDDYRDRARMFEQMASRYPELDNLLVSPEQEEALTFNYLWMMQHQPDARYREGSEAASKLLKMGAKAIYKSYYSNSKFDINSDDDLTSSFSDIDYRLGVSTDKVKLGVKYSF